MMKRTKKVTTFTIITIIVAMAAFPLRAEVPSKTATQQNSQDKIREDKISKRIRMVGSVGGAFLSAVEYGKLKDLAGIEISAIPTALTLIPSVANLFFAPKIAKAINITRILNIALHSWYIHEQNDLKCYCLGVILGEILVTCCTTFERNIAKIWIKYGKNIK